MSLNKVLENYLDTQIWKPCNRIKEKSGAEMIKNTEKSYECKICMDNQLIVTMWSYCLLWRLRKNYYLNVPYI